MMEAARSMSPTSSTTSSLDSNGLPIRRIKCLNEKIFVGDKRYQSATEALVVYLRQFDTSTSGSVDGRAGPSLVSKNGLLTNGLNPTGSVNALGREVALCDKDSTKSNNSSELNGICLNNKKDAVQDLLTSQVSPEMKEEVTDTLREIKLKNLLKKVVTKSKEQKAGKTGLQQEVEAALARSAQLLQKVTMDDIQASQASYLDASDISIPTQILLGETGASSPSTDSSLSQDAENFAEKQNGHVYSYRPDRLNRSDLSMSSSRLSQNRQSRHRKRFSSQDDFALSEQMLSSPSHKSCLSVSSNSSSRLSDLSESLRRIRSRSVPAGLVSKDTDILFDEFNRDTKRNAPRWLNELSPNSSLVKNWDNSIPIVPQWVEDAAKSDISLNRLTELSRKIGDPCSPSMTSQLSNSFAHSKSEGDLSLWKEEPETNLNQSALSPSPPSSTKHVTFTEDIAIPPSHTTHVPIHSTPVRTAYRHSNGLSENVSMGVGINSDNHLRQSHSMKPPNSRQITQGCASSSDVGSDFKSSSLDTLALLTGKPESRQQRPDLSKSNLGPTVFGDGVMLSSIEHDRTVLSPSPATSTNGHISSDGLDGDRSWEKQPTTFKPPVHVGSCDLQDEGNLRKNLRSNLSGGNQPGSMEALKNMLFKLQKEESSVNASSNSSAPNGENAEQTPNVPLLPVLQDYDFETEPGGHSLEKALHHLDRLKTLVKNTTPSSHLETNAGVGSNH